MYTEAFMLHLISTWRQFSWEIDCIFLHPHHKVWHPLHLHRLHSTIWPDPGPGCYYYHHQAGGWMVEDHHTASHRRVIVHAQTFTSPQPHSARAKHDSTQDTLTIISLVTSNLPSIPSTIYEACAAYSRCTQETLS